MSLIRKKVKKNEGLLFQPFKHRHFNFLGVNTLTQSMNNMSINEQLIRRKEEGGFEYHSVIQTSPQSPAHVVPVAYEGKIMHKEDNSSSP